MRYLSMSLLIAIAFVFAGAPHVFHSSPLLAKDDACGLLSQADILKATGLKVADGVVGAPIPGVLARCTWTAEANKVSVTLGDAQHMQLTLSVQQQNGGTSVPDLGSKAVAAKGPGVSGGGYVVTVLDGKGGFGVGVLGPAGTLDHVVALAKVVESHR